MVGKREWADLEIVADSDGAIQLSSWQHVKEEKEIAEPMGKAKSRTSSQRFGTAVYLKGYVTLHELQQALSEQLEDDISGKAHRLLGEILKQKNWITKEQVTEILAYLDSLEK